MPKSVAKTRGPAKPARRQVRSREELSEFIIQSASELFASKGYSEPSIRDIAAAAGVPLPTLYRLFIDKRDVYVQCCKRAAAKQLELVQSFYNKADPHEVVLYKLVRAGFAFKADGSVDYRLLHRVIVEGEMDLIAEETAAYRRTHMYRQVVKAAEEMSRGDLPFLRLMLIDSLFNMMPNIVKAWEPEVRGDDIDKLTRNVLSILFPGNDWRRVAARAARPS